MKYCAEEKYEIITARGGFLVECTKDSEANLAVSKSSFYEWYPRYLEDGIEGLRDRTKRLNQFWNRITGEERECIVEHALEHSGLLCREVGGGDNR